MKEVILKYRHIVYPIFFTALYAFIIMSVFNIYLDNDDTSMSRIVSGMMTGTPDPHCEFINYTLSSIIAFLYKLVQNVNWYSLIINIIPVFGGLWIMIYRFMDISYKKNREYILISVLAILLYSSLCFGQILEPQWTQSAGIVGTMAVFLWYTSNWKKDCSIVKKYFEQILIILMILMCFGIRESVFKMIVPSVCILFVIRAIQKKELKQDIIIIFVSCLCIFTMSKVEQLAYSDATYGQLKTMNSYRAQIADYGGLPDYNEYKDIYQKYDISYEEQCLVNGLAAYEFFENLTMEDLIDYYSVLCEVNDLNTDNRFEIIIAIENAGKAFFDMNSVGHIIILLLLLLSSGILYCKNKDKISLLSNILILGIYFCLWVHLGRSNRFPFRVLFIMHFSLNMILFAILLNSYLRSSINKTHISFRIGMALLGLGIIVAGIFQLKLSINNYRKSSEQYYLQCNAYEYMKNNKKDLFLLGPDFRVFKEKFDFIDNPNELNYIKITGWATITPAFQEMITKGNGEDIWNVIVKRDDIRLVTDYLDWVYIITDYYNSIGYNLDYDVIDIVNTQIEEKKYYIIQLRLL